MVAALARTGKQYRAFAVCEGAMFTASGETQEAANKMVADEIAYQRLQSQKGLPNKLDATL